MIPFPQPLFITFPVLELELVQAEEDKIDFEIQYEMVQSPLDTAHKIKGLHSFRRQQNYLICKSCTFTQLSALRRMVDTHVVPQCGVGTRLDPRALQLSGISQSQIAHL